MHTSYAYIYIYMHMYKSILEKQNRMDSKRCRKRPTLSNNVPKTTKMQNTRTNRCRKKGAKRSRKGWAPTQRGGCHFDRKTLKIRVVPCKNHIKIYCPQKIKIIQTCDKLQQNPYPKSSKINAKTCWGKDHGNHRKSYFSEV